MLSHPETRRAYDLARRQRQELSRNEAARVAAAQAYAAHRPQHTPHRAAHATAQPPREHFSRRTTSTGMKTVFCPRCGTRNRLPQLSNPYLAVCGKCHTPLLKARMDAQEAVLPATELTLPPALMQRLIIHGEIRLQRAQPPSSGRLQCLRCHQSWVVDPQDPLSKRCPRCRSTQWSDFRVFRCRHCEHHFSTSNLSAWPYWVFAECPSCHRAHWHPQCEKNPLRWVLNRLTGMK